LRVGWLLRENRREIRNQLCSGTEKRKRKKRKEEKKGKKKNKQTHPKTQGFIFVRCL